MKALRVLAAGTMICVLTVSARADDKKEKSDSAKLLVGKWEVTTGDKELPVGSVVELGNDGNMKIALKGKEEGLNAIYKVDGDKIQFTLKLSDKDEKKDPLTIKKISEQELVLESKKGAAYEFKRLK